MLLYRNTITPTLQHSNNTSSFHGTLYPSSFATSMAKRGSATSS